MHLGESLLRERLAGALPEKDAPISPSSGAARIRSDAASCITAEWTLARGACARQQFETGPISRQTFVSNPVIDENTAMGQTQAELAMAIVSLSHAARNYTGESNAA